MLPYGLKVPIWRLLVTSLWAVFLLWGGTDQALGSAYLPPPGKVFAGVADKPVSQYERAVGKHPPVYEEFVAWGQYLPALAQDAITVRARMMMAISTAFGSTEQITPAGIADGRGDAWLIGLNHAIYASGNITYVRLMAEMDGYWNPYSAYNADGSPRDSAHSSAQYKRAWKRVTLILRGGPLSDIDATLRRLGMPRLRTTDDLPRPKVAMLWVPQVAPGDPDVPGNQPLDYWPGSRWVDWVGTDFYSKFPNFSGLSAFYDAFGSKPFVFGEYGLWGADDPGWVNSLFDWVRTHRRARMLVYNQGVNPDGPFRLWRYPLGAQALRHRLAGSEFQAYAPEWAP